MAMASDMPKTRARPPCLPARMMGVMKAKLVPVMESRPEPKPRQDMTWRRVPTPLATRDMLIR